MKLKRLLCLLSFFISLQLSAQVLTVDPPVFGADDSITVTFDATKGNAALKDFTENVFAHTGVITGTPNAPSSWRYVQGEWGKYDSKVAMSRIEANKYQLKLHIRSFYGIEPSEQLLQLVFVFRNRRGDIVAKTTDEEDIYFPQIEKQPNGILEEVNGAEGEHIGKLISFQLTKNGQSFGPNALKLVAENACYILKPYSDNTLNVEYHPNTSPEQAQNIQQSISSDVVGEFGYPLEQKNLKDKGNTLELKWANEMKVVIEKEPLRLRFFHKEKEILRDADGAFVHEEADVTGLRFSVQDDEAFYGMGSRAIEFDRRGKRLYSYNSAKYDYDNGEPMLNITIPFVMSSAMYGVYIDDSKRAYFDVAKADAKVLEFGAKTLHPISYYVITGKKPSEIMAEYTGLTGRQPLPPIWALGYIQSKYGYENQQQVYNIIDSLQDADFPVDALVLDLYWFGDKEKMGDLDWDRSRFPNAEKMMADLRKKGVETILITEPYITKASSNFEVAKAKGLFTTQEDGANYVIPDFWAGPTALLDLLKPEARSWMWQFYKKQEEKGVGGWWCDLGEPEKHPLKMQHVRGPAEEVHNIYPFYWAKFISDYYQTEYPNKRLFNLSRSGFAGVQRFSSFPWSGDVSRTWKGFQAQPRIMLGMSLSGMAYMHSDLGGFTGGPKDEELYARWLQMGTFSPIMRAHGVGVPSEPIYYEPQTQDIVRKAIKLRYQMLPYNYTLAYQNSQTGTPIARPMFYDFSQSPECRTLEDQYMWGDALLVAPVLKSKASEMNIYLPKSEWVEWESDQVIPGGTWHKVKPKKGSIPTFVRRGAFLPMMPERNTTTTYNGDTLIIHYYPSLQRSNTNGMIYLDDGKDAKAVEEEAYRLIRLQGNANAKKLNLLLNAEGKGYEGMPKQHELYFEIHTINRPRKVSFQSKLKSVNSFESMQEDANTIYWDDDKKRLYIHISWTGREEKIVVSGKGLL